MGAVVFISMYIEMACYAVLCGITGVSVWRSSRGDRRVNDTAWFMLFCFGLLLIFRDWRILYADSDPSAKILMCFFGIVLCVTATFVALRYGRGARVS